MLEPKKCAENWKEVVKIYNETRETNPEETMKKIVEALGFDTAKETFATVSAIKKHDGRIYGKNREYMDNISINPESVEWKSGNPMLYSGLDDIHTAHINQLIGELRKMEE